MGTVDNVPSSSTSPPINLSSTTTPVVTSSSSRTSNGNEDGEGSGLSGAQIGGIAAGSVGAALLVGGAIGGVVYSRAQGIESAGITEDEMLDMDTTGSMVEDGPTPRRPYTTEV